MDSRALQKGFVSSFPAGSCNLFGQDDHCCHTMLQCCYYFGMLFICYFRSWFVSFFHSARTIFYYKIRHLTWQKAPIRKVQAIPWDFPLSKHEGAGITMRAMGACPRSSVSARSKLWRTQQLTGTKGCSLSPCLGHRLRGSSCTLRLDVPVTPTGGSSWPSASPLPQLLPPLSSARPRAPPALTAVPVPAEAPRPPLVAWLRRHFRPWAPTEMAAASTAFSSASSSSAALLRPGWAPLRRWRALARSTSSSPRSAARYLAPIGSFSSSFSSFQLLILCLILYPPWRGAPKDAKLLRDQRARVPLIALRGGCPWIPAEFRGSSRGNGGEPAGERAASGPWPRPGDGPGI